jgi:hypothetical protein
MALA